MMEEDSHSSQSKHQETQSEDDSKFSKSLQELKDLCSQLHAAAGYCESTFLDSNHKHLVVENTKEYVCRAVVAVVDHLGSVSANLDHQISQAETHPISQTQVRIDFLKQKLFICQEYSDKLALAKLTWRVESPRYDSRYLKPHNMVGDTSLRNLGSENIVANNINIKHVEKIEDESSSQFGESTSEKSENITDFLSHSGLIVHDNLSTKSKPQALSLQLQDKRKNRRVTLFRKSMTSNEILSIIRRRK